ncbi:hypothetical protein [Pseudoclavibacter helvolus]|uniref:Uncharacterized protein n=1 Tax=Pseudoclavibacter helvolus TaxID=255205 RepID=A0A7W4YFL5_9MICO|nr:hypothetical protein [Pseudoclavibacter helvolus]MBB2956990.1 hypothetical protein [Pseudoclavibacter helvolus]
MSPERLEEMQARAERWKNPTFGEFTQLVDEVAELRAVLAPIRALGAPTGESVRMAAMLFASGVSEKQATVYAKASSAGVLGVGEQLLLREAGVRVEPLPASKDELLVIADALVGMTQASERKPFTPEANPSEWAVLMRGAKPVAALVLQQLEAVRRG